MNENLFSERMSFKVSESDHYFTIQTIITIIIIMMMIIIIIIIIIIIKIKVVTTTIIVSRPTILISICSLFL